MENERFGRTRALLGEEKFGRLQGRSEERRVGKECP